MNPDGNLWLGLKRVRLPLVSICVALGLWIIFAKLVVPTVIESAFRGESLPALNNLIQGRATHTVDEYLRDWDQLAWRMTVTSAEFGLLGLALFLWMSSPSFFTKFVGEATPGTLGAMRAWICGITLLITLLEDLPSIAWLPVETRQPRGVMGWLYALPIGFDKLVTSSDGLHLLQLLTEWLLFLGMIGCWTRVVMPLGTICFFLLGGILRDYSFNWHQGWVPLYLITILCVTPCADGWSVDRLWKVIQGRPVVDPSRTMPAYGWSRYALWTAIAVTYWETGLCKFRDGGLSWWHPFGLRATWYEDTLIPREFGWDFALRLTHVPDVVIGLAGAFVVVFESLWITVLFSQRARMFVPPLTIVFHTGVLLLQKILFVDLILAQLLFYDLTSARKAIARKLENKYGKIQVLYDGLCPLCNRTIRTLGAVDLFTRLEFLDFRRLDLNQYNHRHRLALTPEELDREMYVISQGRPYVGYYGYRVLSMALPVLWPFVPMLFLPGVSWVGERIYGYIARNRFTFLHCDTHCPVPSARTAGDHVPDAALSPQPLGYAWLVTVFSVVAAVSFIYKVEFYPLTAWHLYANLNSTGEIIYYKVLGRQPSGTVVQVRLEDAVGALGWDGRYIPRLKQCFGGVLDERARAVNKELDICRKFLTVSGVVYNKRAPSERKITHLEVQEWVWDLRSDPYDPQHGKERDHVIVEIGPISAAAKKEI